MKDNNISLLRQELEQVRKRALELETKLKDSDPDHLDQSFFKLTIEQTQEGIQIIDKDFRYLYLNEAVPQHGRKTREDLLRRTMMECYPGIEKTDVFAVIQDCMKNRSRHALENLFEFPDGSKCWFELFIEPHTMGVLIRSIDISEKKNLEEQYRHSQKMEAIGRLAGGVAHDFNNKLGVMMIYCELLAEAIDRTDHELNDKLRSILNAVKDSATLTKQLLAFSRKQVLDLKVTNLNDIIKSICKGLPKLIGESIKLETFLEAELGNVRVDPSQMDQVILNLCLNARDAMPDGGVITIETTNVVVDEAYCSSHPEIVPGAYVMLAVSDTGTGMTDEVKKKIFEPFFTTKGLGSGTGLGLSSVHGIVKQSRGHIWVYSELGSGTTFKLYFPRVKDALDSVEETGPTDVGIQGTERVLLVEDDPLLQKAFRDALIKAGYTVFAASKPSEATEIFMREQGKFDFLLSDLMLPESNGHELAKKLTAIKPELKFAFVSGYTENTIVHHGVLDTEAVLIQKPVSNRRLLKTIRQILDGTLTKGVI